MLRMITKDYILTSKMFTGSVLFSYSQNRLMAFKIEADLNQAQYQWLTTHLPLEEEQLQVMVKQMRKGKIELAEPDLSFDNFWQLYKYKHGNKQRAKKLWEALSKANKIRAINWLPTYANELKGTGAARMYPETYLNQKRWNN